MGLLWKFPENDMERSLFAYINKWMCLGFSALQRNGGISEIKFISLYQNIPQASLPHVLRTVIFYFTPPLSWFLYFVSFYKQLRNHFLSIQIFFHKQVRKHFLSIQINFCFGLNLSWSFISVFIWTVCTSYFY